MKDESVSDMRRIFFHRHGDNVLKSVLEGKGMWQPDSPLSDKGREQVASVAVRHLQNVSFRYFFRSTFLRTVQTAEIDFPNAKWEYLEHLIPRTWIEFDAAVLKSPEAPLDTLQDAETLLPGFIQVESEWVRTGFHHVLNALTPGESALLVGHQPLIGLLRGSIDPSFPPFEQSIGKGEIYVFNFLPNGVFHSVEHLK